MTPTAVQKTRHRDACTDRETRALDGLVQQRAMQVDVLAEFLGTGRNHAYELAKALHQAGLVHPLLRVGAGPKWIVPTRRAVTGYFGYSLPDWKPSRLWSARGRAIARTRIALRTTTFHGWESERELRYRPHTDTAQRGAYYPYDGRTMRIGHDGGPCAVKVDITHYGLDSSRLAHRIYHAAERGAHDGCTRLLYVYGGALTRDTVYRAAATVASDLEFEVIGLDDLLHDRTPSDGKTPAHRVVGGR
ncbi:hypothetical protein ACIBG0_17165 [Nocardia sp. NPDC050630]|uniref:hypothetical protein n=1 Tax=Nocardia sp. NPDC050630 TaxID=3364321 RepID=UPI00379B874D